MERDNKMYHVEMRHLHICIEYEVNRVNCLEASSIWFSFPIFERKSLMICDIICLLAFSTR